ncbi:MAG: ornithine carbamoyltransferase [Deltaproteobacteria bacterium RIFCSPLOWO2_12_FULL_40_28]|nr:MAG: ornithine carbamoyltransferase [Deltaproteobacteria bacterium RIFCSPHIGHO2_02_FULL_40_28]OGQ20900.1 MAG: ornithine carbamoyltransferase [Deltaproteobacteria bacterium RIFCSPHIGHO2_12_FULL_40_32]OGQ39301.1 MAG: ornithine carbamoyltransferase [Deltaproteobacteria bacterium RIFCSPLOWO2_02_FULL_40_36]OGQ54582.1 MAG: ornithine carbamoyltransferase [Deltaproteobacteria bacterium RIFCSPLOWO2_12_FULL_40_28]
MKKDFLHINNFSVTELKLLIKRALTLKKTKKPPAVLKGKVLGMIFAKESTRTRISFEVAMLKLGGHAIYLGQQSTQISRGESYADTGRVLSRYLDALVVRTYEQRDIEELAKYSTIPIINGLTDLHHPCQVLTDLVTLVEADKKLENTKICYIGDGNNMTNSWIEAALTLGLTLNIACPKGYEPDSLLLEKIKKHSHILFTHDPEEAIKNADVINTDTWFSMGQEISETKKESFKPFQINTCLLKQAHPQAIVLHCLPAHRGEEITDEVIDGPQSMVFEQAANRLYTQMALLEYLVGKKRRMK